MEFTKKGGMVLNRLDLVESIDYKGEDMEFYEDLGQYVYEKKNIIFAWDEEPQEDYLEIINGLVDNYYSHLDEIIAFMMPELREMYGEINLDDVQDKLGKPVIDYNLRQLLYLEHTFDYEHIFTIEFADDKFEDLKYFSVDG